MSQLFDLGRIVVTPNALGSLDHERVQAAIRRHSGGDWGELDAEDKKAIGGAGAQCGDEAGEPPAAQ